MQKRTIVKVALDLAISAGTTVIVKNTMHHLVPQNLGVVKTVSAKIAVLGISAAVSAAASTQLGKQVDAVADIFEAASAFKNAAVNAAKQASEENDVDVESDDLSEEHLKELRDILSGETEVEEDGDDVER